MDFQKNLCLIIHELKTRHIKSYKCWYCIVKLRDLYLIFMVEALARCQAVTLCYLIWASLRDISEEMT